MPKGNVLVASRLSGLQFCMTIFSASEIYTTPIPPKDLRVERVDRANYMQVTQHENRMFEFSLYAFRKQLIVLVKYKGGFDYLLKSKQFF